MSRFFSFALAVVATASLASACSGETDPTVLPPDPVPIYAVSEVGGCAMMGPNCITRVLWTDGLVTVYRQPALELPLAGLSSLTPDATSEVDPSVPEAVARALEEADISAVVAGLPQGTCWACVDGVDYILLLATSDGEVRIRSADTALDPTVPLIAELNNAAAAMGQNTDLPILNR